MKTPKIITRGAGWLLVVREQPSTYERSILGAANNSEAVHELVRERICREPAEVMYALALDGRNRVTALVEVARGGLHGCAIAARDILRPMICAGASAFVLVHNHPSGDSGDPLPSPEDIVFTKIVAQAAETVGVQLLDHIIVGSWDRHASFLSLGAPVSSQLDDYADTIRDAHLLIADRGISEAGTARYIEGAAGIMLDLIDGLEQLAKKTDEARKDQLEAEQAEDDKGEELEALQKSIEDAGLDGIAEAAACLYALSLLLKLRTYDGPIDLAAYAAAKRAKKAPRR